MKTTFTRISDRFVTDFDFPGRAVVYSVTVAGSFVGYVASTDGGRGSWDVYDADRNPIAGPSYSTRATAADAIVDQYTSPQ